MKKFIYLVVLICSFGLASCTPETENLFEGTSADRIEKDLEVAKEALVSAPNGWLMEYYPSSQQLYGGYNVLASLQRMEMLQFLLILWMLLKRLLAFIN